MIEVKHLSKLYGKIKAVNDISFTVKKGQLFAFLGVNGAGKSTTISMLTSELTPTSGIALIDGVNVQDESNLIKEKIGVVFQNYRLLPKKTVFENIAFALEVTDTPKVEIRKKVRRVLELVGLEDKANAFPHELSGGQQQRVAIARAIVNNPKVLIADEPTGNLDPDTSKEIIELLEKINEVNKTTVLVVTHDRDIVQKYKKRTIRIEDGCIKTDTSLGGYNI